ncbi:hypothetical protein BDZ91DRAFT_782608 [Kalaharituber pfeilii]|nr:hypothetical protein BDZ91DRAFT_782608 [Kalaharituber pfeilii]
MVQSAMLALHQPPCLPLTPLPLRRDHAEAAICLAFTRTAWSNYLITCPVAAQPESVMPPNQARGNGGDASHGMGWGIRRGGQQATYLNSKTSNLDVKTESNYIGRFASALACQVILRTRSALIPRHSLCRRERYHEHDAGSELGAVSGPKQQHKQQHFQSVESKRNRMKE